MTLELLSEVAVREPHYSKVAAKDQSGKKAMEYAADSMVYEYGTDTGYGPGEAGILGGGRGGGGGGGSELLVVVMVMSTCIVILYLQSCLDMLDWCCHKRNCPTSPNACNSATDMGKGCGLRKGMSRLVVVSTEEVAVVCH